MTFLLLQGTLEAVTNMEGVIGEKLGSSGCCGENDASWFCFTGDVLTFFFFLNKVFCSFSRLLEGKIQAVGQNRLFGT